MKYSKSIPAFLFLLLVLNHNAFSQIKILFDATKAESAGNADWVIDADQHNLGWNPDAQLNGGTESNAQKIPVPAQSGINSSTDESFWQGGISNWGIDCVKQGYTVESLPYNGNITYQNSSNPQDLSQYQLFVVCEPNILFTSSEKSAIIAFLENGGSLFMISDHDQSDRNGDGYDSPTIWNNLMVGSNFGFTFNLNSFSQTSTSIITSLSDSIANGPYGHVTEVLWSSGTDITLDPTVNPSIKGVVFRNGFLNNNTKVMFAYGRYGSGKIAVMGDSSPADDGSGDDNDVLYNGYISDANGNHQKLIMNATIWLLSSDINSSVNSVDYNVDLQLDYFNHSLHFKQQNNNKIQLFVFNEYGQIVLQKEFNSGNNDTDLSSIANGIYFAKVISSEGKQKAIKIFKN